MRQSYIFMIHLNYMILFWNIKKKTERMENVFKLKFLFG